MAKDASDTPFPLECPARRNPSGHALPRAGHFSGEAACAPAKGDEPREGARVIHRATRGAGSIFPYRSIQGAPGEARGGVQRGAGGGGGVKSAF